MIKKYLKAFIWPIVFMFGQILILGLTYIIINPNDFNKFMSSHSYIVSIFNLLVFLPMFLKIYKKYKNNYNGKLKDIIKIISIGLILSFVLNYIIYLIKIKIGNVGSVNYNIFYIINISLIGPILEEYLFRGIVYNRLLEFNSSKKSYMITTIFFAFVHTGILNVIYAFIMGLILNKIYIKYKNINENIIFHIVINFTSSLLFPLIITM